jgi:hypothetical protein
VESFKTKKPKDASYISASYYICNAKMTVILTVTEEENNRYPDNLQTVCFYNVVEVDDDDEAEAEEGEQYDGSGPAVYTSWKAVKIHACLHPCIILDSYQVNAKEHYEAKMLPVDSSDGRGGGLQIGCAPHCCGRSSARGINHESSVHIQHVFENVLSSRDWRAQSLLSHAVDEEEIAIRKRGG